ncbi:hypothetical protein PRIPAC_77919, partial [Pristionchus pacificus]|uniref:G protein-coupled receptor n=1 Tax=Pristionchus pacificus TaxID=54126 RepID=A0A2A6CPY8_PRIPA
MSMSALDDKMYIVVIITMSTFALLANTVFIFLIKHKTPKDLSAYSNLLLKSAYVDLFSALCSALCVPRVETAAGRIVFVHVGPCTLVAGFAQCVGLSILLLFISVVYRLRILRAHTPFARAIVNLQLLRAATAATAFAALSMPLFYGSGSYNIHGFSQHQTISALDMTNGWLPRLSFLSIFVAFAPGLVGVFTVRRRLMTQLAKIQRRAERQHHQMIYRSLSAQIVLPMAYCVAAAFWMLDVTGVVRCAVLQRSVYVVTNLFSLVSPLTNMYYIPPYRRYLCTYFSRRSSPVSS